jgi:hypothetical protein
MEIPLGLVSIPENEKIWSVLVKNQGKDCTVGRMRQRLSRGQGVVDVKN